MTIEEKTYRSHQERAKAILAKMEKMISQGWQQAEIARRSRAGQKTIGRFLNGGGSYVPRLATMTRLETFFAELEKEGEVGFQDAQLYHAIAGGMNASLDNKAFIRAFTGDYVVIRAQFPSQLPLISTLRIYGDDDGVVVRYEHEHISIDAPSMLTDEAEAGTTPVLRYSGFVFNAQGLAFFLSTSAPTAHVKQMIVSLPAINLANGTEHAMPGLKKGAMPAMNGLVLSVSASERVPFAARVLVEKLPVEKRTRDKWTGKSLGLRKSWKDLPPLVKHELAKAHNYGLLYLHTDRSRWSGMIADADEAKSGTGRV
jgi:transcriptional regulator with XRE-family HTH domain